MAVITNEYPTPFWQGEIMKKSYLTAVFTLTCLIGLGISSRAQDTEGVRVNVPFEFVAGGTTLPPGTYKVGRLSVDAYSGVTISSFGHSALVLPALVDGASAEQLKLRFEHVEGKYFLSEADTPGGMYTFALPRVMVALAQMKDKGTMSSGGTN
jgi:hypothetical protein